jgi:hypothetical protein
MDTDQINATSEPPETIRRLNRDLARAASTLSIDEARYLVDAYYTIQEYRMSAGKRVRSLADSGNPHGIVLWFFEQDRMLESQLKRVLDFWTLTIPAARWARSIVGIGPMIAAGLAAHIDVPRCNTVGRIWRFAGLDPTVVWRKGERCPWNAKLKKLCWSIGDCFVKVSGHPADVYGKLYLRRKAIEQERNEAGKFADQAARKLERFKIGKDTDAYAVYAAGKLPPAHIHARAKRWTVKLFLAHYHHVAYTLATGTAPPKPYVVSVLGHGDMIMPPNFPMQEVA